MMLVMDSQLLQRPTSTTYLNRCRGKGLESFDNLIPVYNCPKFIEILFLSPDSVIEQPAVFVYADTK